MKMDSCLAVVLILVATFSTCIGVDSETYRCPRTVRVNRYVKTHGDSCYQFITRETNWYGAHDDCRSRGGHVVTIRDRSTQNFIVRTLRSFHWPRNGIWLGATDRQNEMDWKWVTGHRVKYGFSNWASGQPSCHIFCFEDCGLMRLDDGGKWHDYKCDWLEDYSYICEYPLSPRTTTTATTTSATTSTTTTTTPTTTTTTSTTTTAAPAKMVFKTTLTSTDMLKNSTENTTVIEKDPIVVVGNFDYGMSKMDSEPGSETSPVTIIGLVLGLLLGLFLGLCLGVFFFRRRNKQEKEDLPSVVFSNPNYVDPRTPLNYVEEEENSCCAGGVSFSQAPTPVKRPFGPPVPKRDYFDPHPFLASPRNSAADGGNDYDDITAQKLMFASGVRSGNVPDEEGAVGGCENGNYSYRDAESCGLVDRETSNEYEEPRLVDHHFDVTTGENYYESMENVRMAMEQNVLNEQQEERYVPFQFDSQEA